MAANHEQVVSAFAVAATLSVSIGVIMLLSGQVSHYRDDPVSRDLSKSFKKLRNLCPKTVSKALDNSIVNPWRSLISQLDKLRLLPAPRENILWARYGRQVTFVWSDQMLISCIAILSVAFAKRGTMSSYHFTILTDLAWLAANAHLVTIPILLPALRESTLQRWVRGLGMLAACALLLVVSIEGANYGWNAANHTCVAKCVFLNEDPTFFTGGMALVWSLVNVALLFWDYGTMMWLLLSPKKSMFSNRLDQFFEDWITSIQAEDGRNLTGGKSHSSCRFMLNSFVAFVTPSRQKSRPGRPGRKSLVCMADRIVLILCA